MKKITNLIGLIAISCSIYSQNYIETGKNNEIYLLEKNPKEYPDFQKSNRGYFRKIKELYKNEKEISKKELLYLCKYIDRDKNKILSRDELRISYVDLLAKKRK